MSNQIIASGGFRSAAARELARSPRGRQSEKTSEERTRSFFRDDDGRTTLVDGRERRDPRSNYLIAQLQEGEIV